LFGDRQDRPAFAQLSVHIGIGVPLPPPAPMVEVVPVPAYGNVWAPGYRAWQHERWERRGDRWHIHGHRH